MRPSISILAIVGLCAACSRSPGSSAVQAEWQRGDRIVVEVRGGQFAEARVLVVRPDTLQVQKLEGGDSVDVSPAEAYRLPPSAGALRVGQIAICRASGIAGWVPCRLVSSLDGRFRVEGIDGKQWSTEPGGVVAPNQLTLLNLERRFSEAAAQRVFLEAVRAAGSPRAAPGWRPGPREPVVVRQGGGWYTARVHELMDDGVRVRWEADQRVTLVPYSEVAPMPPQESPPVVGAYVLVRPASPAQPWEPMRIESRVDEDRWRLRSRTGEITSRLARDIVALGPSK